MTTCDTEDDEICEAFRKEGILINSVWDLLYRNDYHHMIPFLVDFLAKAESSKISEGIARALSVKGLDDNVSAALIQRLKKPLGEGAVWAFGNAISVTATEKDFEGVLQLISDKNLGSGRQMLCDCLGRIGKKQKDRSFNALQKLLDDPELTGHVICGFYKLGDPRAIELIKPYLTYKHKWVAKKAAATIKKLEKKLAKPA